MAHVKDHAPPPRLVDSRVNLPIGRRKGPLSSLLPCGSRVHGFHDVAFEAMQGVSVNVSFPQATRAPLQSTKRDRREGVMHHQRQTRRRAHLQSTPVRLRFVGSVHGTIRGQPHLESHYHFRMGFGCRDGLLH